MNPFRFIQKHRAVLWRGKTTNHFGDTILVIAVRANSEPPGKYWIETPKDALKDFRLPIGIEMQCPKLYAKYPLYRFKYAL